MSERSPYIDEAFRLFDEGEFFLAHETLEELWVGAAERDRDFLQGLIHLAVGFHHHLKGNDRGARRQFGKALTRLAAYPDAYLDVDVGSIRASAEEALAKIDKGEPAPPPKLS